MSTKWNRLCKTCNAILSNDQEVKYHQQTYQYHKIESSKEAHDRSFKLLAFQFKNSFTPTIGKTNSFNSVSSSLASPSDESSSSIVFAPNCTVSPSEYKENNISFNNQRLIFISDDQESFEPLYGNSEHSDKEPEDDSNVNTDPISLPSSKNSNMDLYNKSPPTTAASAYYISHPASQTNMRQYKQDQISGQVFSHYPQDTTSGHVESPTRNSSGMPTTVPFFVSPQQQPQYSIVEQQNQSPLHIPPYLQRLQSFPPPNSYPKQPPQTAPYNSELTYLDDAYRIMKTHRRTSVDYSMYSGSSIHKERLSRKEYKNRFIGRSNRPRPLSQGDGGYSNRIPHYPSHLQNNINASLGHKQGYMSNLENSRAYSLSNSNLQRNIPFSLPTTADSEIHASPPGFPAYGQKPYYQLQNEQQPLPHMNEYSVPHSSMSNPYERRSSGSTSQGSIVSTRRGSFGVPIPQSFKQVPSSEYNNTAPGQTFQYGLPLVSRFNSSTLLSQRPSTASSSVSSVHNNMYFDNNPDSRKNSVCFPMKKESYVVAENREVSSHYAPNHTNSSPYPPLVYHQENKVQQSSTNVALRTPNFNSPSYASSSMGNPPLSASQQFPGSLPPLQQRQQKFTNSKEKYVTMTSPALPQTEDNLNKARNPQNNNQREYRRY